MFLMNPLELLLCMMRGTAADNLTVDGGLINQCVLSSLFHTNVPGSCLCLLGLLSGSSGPDGGETFSPNPTVFYGNIHSRKQQESKVHETKRCPGPA